MEILYVQQLLTELNIHKSPGYDSLHPKILKVLGENVQFVAAVSNYLEHVLFLVTPKVWKSAAAQGLKNSLM